MKTALQKVNKFIFFLYPIATFYIFESYTHNAFTTMKVPIQILNFVFFEFVMLLLIVLIGKIHIALIIETVLFAIIGLANYFVLQFRSAPIMPWDIFSIRTATSVADNFQYTLSRNAILTLIGFVILMILESRCKITLSLNWKKRCVGAIVICALISVYTSMLHKEETVSKFKLYDKLFTPTVMSKRDGTAIAFLMELQYLTVKKPDGYNETEAASLLNTYQTEETITHTPNIIVIMDEAFSDLSVLGDFTTNTDYMPFMRSLMNGAEDTVSGHLNVSVLGGNTANTEFEYLTGNSMAFLPQGSIPYQQYITQAIASTPSYLQTLGYSTIGMHPYYAKGWDRERVYPLLGLEQSYFIDDFSNPELIRKYVSDKSDFEKIIQLYESKEAGEPLFLFNVTMQNHSSYTDDFDNFHPDITVEGSDSKALNNYLSLIKLSDGALEELISYFKEQDEDTIIVFFGDHQPANSVAEPIWKLQGKSGDSLTESDLALRYKVPFIIWANYDIEEESNLETSANFLGTKTLSVAGLPLSNYDSYLNELQQNYPIISSIEVTDKKGNSTPADEQSDALNQYQQMQYYQLFKDR